MLNHRNLDRIGQMSHHELRAQRTRHAAFGGDNEWSRLGRIRRPSRKVSEPCEKLDSAFTVRVVHGSSTGRAKMHSAAVGKRNAPLRAGFGTIVCGQQQQGIAVPNARTCNDQQQASCKRCYLNSDARSPRVRR